MRAYELMYILSPLLEEEAVSERTAAFDALITSHGGEVERTESAGKRRLAYEIEGFREGTYVLSNFKCPVETAKELERVLKITDDVIRYLLLNVEE